MIKIIVYGAGMIGKQLASRLLAQGHAVINYIDARADEIVSLNGIEVISIDEARRINDKESIVVFIAVKNVFQHAKIVEELRNIGFEYIIFNPVAIIQDFEVCDNLKMINDVYEAVVENEGEFNVHVPSCKNINLVEVKDWAIIKEAHNNVIAYVPIELLFTNDNPDNKEWSKKNFLATYVAVDMYEGLNSKNINYSSQLVNEYINKIALVGAKKMDLVVGKNWERNVLTGRKDVYWHMKRKMSLQPDFFINNCPYVSYEKNRFILLSSGKNRISFLIEEGFQYIPVEMSSQDYANYLNPEKAKKVYTLMEKLPTDNFTTIPHPYFYYIDSQAPGYVFGWLKKVGKIISRINYYFTKNNYYEGMKIIDALEDQGSSSRFLSNLGCCVTRISNTQTDVENLLYDLLGAEYTLKAESNEKCDVCLVNTNIANKDITKKIIRNCKKICFVQVIKNEEWLDEYLREKGFPIRHLIYEDFWGSDVVVGYVYINKDIDSNKILIE